MRMRRTRTGGLASAIAILLLAACGGSASVSSSAASPSAPAAKPAASTSAAAPPSAAASAKPAAASAAAKPSAGDTAVRLASSQNVTGNAPVWMTQQAGLFQKAGANVDLQSINATAAIKELAGGHLDALVAGAPESISARAEGAAIQIVAVFQHACDMQLVAPKDVTAVAQLKGKSVAVITKPSVNGICTVADLRNHGLQADKDYKLIETGAPGTYAAMVAAIDAHHVDAGAMQTNFANKLAAGGQFHILYDLASEQDLKEAASSLTFSEAFIKAHPADVQNTLNALLQGQEYFNKNKPEAEGVLKSIFKITDQKELDDIHARLGQLMAKDVTPTPDLFPDIVAALAQVEPNIKTLDLNSLLNPTFAQHAAKAG